MRLFIGIPLASEVTGELSAIVARYRRKEDGLRWAAPETWHITLQVLGETNPEQYKCLTARLGELRSPPVPIRLEGLGFFDRTGIFLAGVEVTPPLLALEQRVTAATSQCGFVPETRPYQPHITLARGKGRDRGHGAGIGNQSALSAIKKQIQRQPVFTRFTAGEFNLYESFVGPGGSRYEIRARYPLN